MAEVVCRIRPSVHASYQAEPAKFGVSLRAVYDKLEHRTAISAAWSTYRRQARSHPPALGGRLPALLSGYASAFSTATISADGTRLKNCARWLPVPCPSNAGRLDAQTMLVTDVPAVRTGTRKSVPSCRGSSLGESTTCGSGPEFLHDGFWFAWPAGVRMASSATTPLVVAGEQQAALPGTNRYGRVYEQRGTFTMRRERLGAARITIALDKPTRDGIPRSIFHQPAGARAAKVIARLYQKR